MTTTHLTENDSNTIVDTLTFPYAFFSNLLSSPNKTALDIGCGAAIQSVYLDNKFGDVLYMDQVPQFDWIIKGNIQHIPLPSKSVDVTFCLETIEHIDRDKQSAAIEELGRVTKTAIVLGSVNKIGPSHFPTGELIFKGTHNPDHIAELDPTEFMSLVLNSFSTAAFFCTMVQNLRYQLISGLRPDGYFNYAIILL